MKVALTSIGVQRAAEEVGQIPHMDARPELSSRAEHEQVAGVVSGRAQKHAAKARTELGWSPNHAGLVEEFRHGSYRKSESR